MALAAGLLVTVTAAKAATRAPSLTLAYTTEKGIEIIRADGTGKTTVPGSYNHDDAARSPDGTRLAFMADTYNPGTMRIADLRTSTWKPLLGGNVAYPLWTRDGRRIIFYTAEDDRYWSVNLAGGDRRRIRPGHAPYYLDPFGTLTLYHLSPDGTKAAASSSGSDREQVYVTRADGTGAHALTHNRLSSGDDPFFSLSDPAWSPDGKTLAFRASNTDDNHYDIDLINADGRGLRRLVRVNDAAVPDDPPAWSPDGSLIAVSVNGGIIVIKPDGSGERVLAHEPRGAWSLSWSPRT